MFHASKWIPIAWILASLIPAHNALAEEAWQANGNVDVYNMFHETEQPEQLIETFHIELNDEPHIEAHIYMTDQKEPFNNPIRMEIILSCGDRAFKVNREDHSQSLKTFCDYSTPQLVDAHLSTLPKQKILQMLLYQFDEREGQCPATANTQEIFPLESIIQICHTLE